MEYFCDKLGMFPCLHLILISLFPGYSGTVSGLQLPKLILGVPGYVPEHVSGL